MIRRRQALLLAGMLAAGPGPAAAQSWLETRISIEELAEAGDYAAAAELSDRLLEQVAAEFGDVSPDYADSLMLLAEVDLGDFEFLRAEGRVYSAIGIFRELEGPNSPSLIEPYVLLGELLYADGAHTPALEAFEEARLLTRRELGLFNQDQLAILAKMTHTALSSGDRDLALDLQDEAVSIVGRSYGTDSIEYVGAILDQADWLARVGDRRGATQIRYSLHGVVNDFPEDRPSLTVSALREIARRSLLTTRYDPLPPRELTRALKIVDGLEPPDPVLHASVLKDIADWHFAMRSLDEADAALAAAWAILDQAKGGQEIQQEWFGEPEIIRASALMPSPMVARALTTGTNAPGGQVELEFEVLTSGRASGIRVVGSNPPGLVDDAAIQSIERSSFRPAMAGGEAVVATRRFIWNFHYHPDRVQDLSASFRRSD